MTVAPPARIALSAELPEAAEDLLRLLTEHDLPARLVDLTAADSSILLQSDLVILDGGARAMELPALCRRWRLQARGQTTPILLIGNDAPAAGRLASFDSTIEGFLLRPFAAAEFLTQVRSLLRWKRAQDRLTDQSLELGRINERLQEGYRRQQEDLALAIRLGEQLRQESFPPIPGVRFALSHQPCGRAGGDRFAVFPIGNGRVGLYLADIMGQGITGSLLAAHLTAAMRPVGDSTWPSAPGAVLGHLNTELAKLAAVDLPFVSMVYAVYDTEQRTLQLARAGHPYPILVPYDAAPIELTPPGGFLGVCPTTFAVETRTLRPGDRLLVYSDGLKDASETVGTLAHRWRAEPLNDYLECIARAGQASDQDASILALEVTHA